MKHRGEFLELKKRRKRLLGKFDFAEASRVLKAAGHPNGGASVEDLRELADDLLRNCISGKLRNGSTDHWVRSGGLVAVAAPAAPLELWVVPMEGC